MSARPEPRSQAMPMERAILWNPPAAPGTTAPGRPSSRSPYPIFFQQEAVIALQEHLKSSPTQAIFGFLIGDLYRDPETGVLYTVIDKTLKLSQAIYGDKTEVVVSRLWDRMQEQLAKASASLLGWYHSHPGQGGFLTTHDVETHEKFFTDPRQVLIEREQSRGRKNARLAHAAAEALANLPRPRPHQLLESETRSDGTAEPLRDAHHHGIGAQRQARGRHAHGNRGVPQARAVQVDRHSRLARDANQRIDRRRVQHAAACRIVRVLDRQCGGARHVR